MTAYRQEGLSTSVYAMICHPLLATRNTDTMEWGCRAITPEGMREYCTKLFPVLQNPAYEVPILELQRMKRESNSRLIEWITRKGMSLERMPHGIIDTKSKHVYPIEFIVSRHAKPCLVSILYTQKRIPRTLVPSVIAHAGKIHTICVEQYAMQVTTVIINVFRNVNAQGIRSVEIAGISRPSPQKFRSKDRHHSESESAATMRRRLPTNDEQVNASSSSAIPALVSGGGGTGTTTGSVT